MYCRGVYSQSVKLSRSQYSQLMNWSLSDCMSLAKALRMLLLYSFFVIAKACLGVLPLRRFLGAVKAAFKNRAAVESLNGFDRLFLLSINIMKSSL